MIERLGGKARIAKFACPYLAAITAPARTPSSATATRNGSELIATFVSYLISINCQRISREIIFF